MTEAPSSLVITADDYGYRPAYDEGILEAVQAGAVDAASAMVTRDPDPAPLLETRVEIGLHLELEEMPGVAADASMGPVERKAALAALRGQLDRFEELFGRAPAYLDGHHHCHARDGFAPDVARIAAARNLPVRSVSARHRRLLRGVGVATPDRLVGRLTESEPPLPDEIERVLGGGEPPAGVTEWMVHPGHRDPHASSSFDAAREQDLELVVDLSDALGSAFRRGTHAALTR